MLPFSPASFESLFPSPYEPDANLKIEPAFLRGDVDLNGVVELTDIVWIGGYLNSTYQVSCVDACDIDDNGVEAMRAQIGALRAEVRGLKVIFDEHPGLQDRFISAGCVAPELADQLGLCGLAGRASGMSWDLRAQFPSTPYDALDVRMATHRNGDVAARVTVRFEEVMESLDLCWVILDRLPRGEIRTELPIPIDGSLGLGWVEGWRGEVLVALEAGPNASLRRVHPHDPSWQNWPVLEHAVIGNIVPDFPLINKSFNLSYSGVDL
jgi:Ni,Fe-hydrogenase III large subunit